MTRSAHGRSQFVASSDDFYALLLSFPPAKDLGETRRRCVLSVL